MTTEIGKTYVDATTPGRTASTKRICSVAYATEEIGSEQKTGSRASASTATARGCPGNAATFVAQNPGLFKATGNQAPLVAFAVGWGWPVISQAMDGLSRAIIASGVVTYS